MKLEEAKQKFVDAWGTFGTNWGINRTMAQIHALMLVSDEPLSTDQVMETLDISRGNANMNLRALIDWGLVERKVKLGERVEYFAAEKDIWKVTVKIVRERRKREIEPLRSVLQQMRTIDDKEQKKKETITFLKMVDDIDSYAAALDKLADKLAVEDKGWVLNSLMKMVAK